MCNCRRCGKCRRNGPIRLWRFTFRILGHVEQIQSVVEADQNFGHARNSVSTCFCVMRTSTGTCQKSSLLPLSSTANRYVQNVGIREIRVYFGKFLIAKLLIIRIFRNLVTNTALTQSPSWSRTTKMSSP